MSGGISAIKGFDYQATVILDRLFDHFDHHGPSAKVRPEGIDDLDLSWNAGTAEHRRYEQIKKPTEDRDGNLNPTPWTLAATVEELLPNTVSHLSGNIHEQVWIVGDEVDDAVKLLIDAGKNAPIATAKSYWTAVHGLARNDAFAAVKLESSIRQKLRRWHVPADLPANPTEALSRIATEFDDFAKKAGAAEDVATHHRVNLTQLHGSLPGVLDRTSILSAYGTERQVTQRVFDRLAKQYTLSRPVIENTLFRNLRGFINEISKQPGRTFDWPEFEFEVRNVWPHMVPIRDVPPLQPEHIARVDLTELFTRPSSGKALEAVGISGSGKTMLAAEVVEQLQIVDPGRRAYYAEVRPDTGLREVLVGVAFHLRRIGISEPFAISVQADLAHEEVLRRLARFYTTVSQEILLLLDLVEGTCSDAFARDLATFVRALSSSGCRIAVLGQESALRQLSPLERDEHGVNRIDIRGFRFEEFLALVAHYHSSPDRAMLWDIYHRVTAGRAAGLFAQLAQSLARASSLQEMADMAARPADDVLAHAERQRFARLSEGARGAAEKLVCFALPFARKDAEKILPDDNVGAAIRELLTQGLLRPYNNDSFEMHEIVRAGLEGTIALRARRSTHEALAAWYGTQGLVTAEIHHLEKAGKPNEAQDRAREAFLRGERWAALSPYIVRYQLVSAQEAIRVIARAEPVEDQYLLSSLLRKLGGPVSVDELLQVLREQPKRLCDDYQWALAVTEAILDLDSARLHELILLSVGGTSDPTQQESVLNWLMIAASRKGGVIGPQTIAFFNSQPTETKRQLLRFLLLDRRREALQHAFQFLTAYSEPAEKRRTSPGGDLALHIRDREDTVEFLAAIPAVAPAAMVTAKSALLGPLANFVWSQRTVLRAHCIEIAKDGTLEERILGNAIRVLVFLAEPSICTLCDPLLTRKDAVREFALLVPALVPAFCDRPRYEARLLDRTAAPEERIGALFVLASVGAELGRIYQQLKSMESDPKELRGWELWFLTLCAQAPFPEAIPLLEAFMESAGENGVHLIISALTKLGELPVPAATAMLIQALNHANPQVRQCAMVGLSQRRSRSALASLMGQYERENVKGQAAALAAAIVASGPQTVTALEGGLNSSATRLWRCILAMRLRDATIAGELVTIATDSALSWWLRRAAICAAGRLPYEAALEQMMPVVMSERSPLTIDGNSGLHCHSVMSSILLSGAQGIAPMFARGRAAFIEFLADTFEASWKQPFFRESLPSGVEAAGWLFDRLTYQGWPAKREAPDLVLNELSIPMLHSAVLRSLRLSGRADLIDEQLATAHHVWLAMKCLQERSRAGRGEMDLASRLKDLVEGSPCKGHWLLHRFIDEIGGAHAIPAPTGSGDVASPKAPALVSTVSYADAVRALSGASIDFQLTSPWVLEAMTTEQCERLVRLADPTNDRDHGTETYVPSVQFTSDGHVVAQRRVSYKGESRSAMLRPAIAAANRFKLPIPWHEELMTGILSTSYVPRYLACLAELNDSDRFYDALAQYEEVLMACLCTTRQASPVLKYVDARVVPSLARYVSSGTDEFFEGLCALARQVNTPEIDPVLAGLLYRWTRRFDLTSPILQHVENHALWRGFHRLAEHPRFGVIEGWQSRLAAVLRAPLSSYHAETIVRVLERDSRSYLLIESRLVRVMNWPHMVQEEIDRLDVAAERLFPQLLEP